MYTDLHLYVANNKHQTLHVTIKSYLIYAELPNLNPNNSSTLNVFLGIT